MTLPSIERVREVLHYDVNSGRFEWLKSLSNRTRVGNSAGSRIGKYLYISIDGYRTGAQRVAVAWVTGRWPVGEVDHIDANSLNNVFSNLRVGTGQINRQNVRRPRRHNRLGILGVQKVPSGRYRARLHVDGTTIYSRVVETAELAHGIYVEMKRAHHQGCTL